MNTPSLPPPDAPAPAAKTQPAKPAFSWKRMAIFLGAGAVAWVIFAQGIPRLLFPLEHRAAAVAPVAEPAPEPAVETPPLEAPDFSAHETPAAPPAPPPVPPPAAPAPSESAIVAQGLTHKIEQLESRLEEMDKRQQEAQASVQLLLGYQELRDTVTGGEPYTPALDRFALLAAKHAEILAALEPLKPYAAQGIPDLRLLREEFDDAAAATMRMTQTNDGSFWGRLKANLSTLIVVRRIGAQEGATAEAIIARAEAALEQNDVAGAGDELKTLPDAAKQPFATWMAHAQAYLAHGPALAALQQRILALSLPTP
jgi:hypothetical protein